MVDNSRLLARRVRLLESELLMFRNYLSECQILFEQYEQEYTQDIAHFVLHFQKSLQQASDKSDPPKSPTDESGEISVDDPRVRSVNESEEEAQPPPPSISKKHPDWAKSLYRKIALITHPDKIKEDERKERLEQYFQSASRALEENDYNELVSLALALDLKSELESRELVPIYKDQLATIKEKIAAIEQSVPWLWGEGYGMHEVKSKILIAVLQNHKIAPSVDEITAAIELREKDALA